MSIGMKEYLNRNKVFRLMAYMIDIGILLLLCMWIMPMFDAISPQLVYQQIARVHDAVDMSIMQEETMILMSYIERFTMMFALIGCNYDSILLSVFETTIGKAIFRLYITCEETITWKRSLYICLRSVLKGGMLAFLGSILLIFSGFSMIASPMQLSIQDRIAHTKIVHKK